MATYRIKLVGTSRRDGDGGLKHVVKALRELRPVAFKLRSRTICSNRGSKDRDTTDTAYKR
eukprot:2729869-Pyramimonas_sp.AAC.1